MAELPAAPLTFLLSDVEQSTRLWEREADAMRAALARHDAIFACHIAEHGGTIVKPRGEGDSLFIVFADARAAVAAACAVQRALFAERWPTSLPLRVRLALHCGPAEQRDGDYYGAAVNRCARLRAIAHGGQTLLSEAVAEAVRDHLPEGAALRSLGLHRLKDLTAPERVFQLVHPDLPAAFPPVRSLTTLSHNLPAQLTSFVGREAAIVHVRGLLAGGGGARLVTLIGAGGAGKTRLALQVAADLLDEYPDGVWLAELAALADPALVPHAVAAAVGVHEQADRTLMATLQEALRPRQLLLVLDNCEHLVTACAAVAEALLRSCPHLRILATSRELIGIGGEIAWRVPSLDLPEAGPSLALDQVARAEAVRLFVERAAAARPGFALTAENAPAVLQICQRLDGMPLAIELAAARMRVMSAQQIAARLDDRFRLLTGGSRVALPRQQTLRGALDWSHALLAAEEQVLFRRLAVFAGGWSLDAAEAVCAAGGITAGDVVDLLGRLVDKSLVWVDEQEEGPRYRLLETIREYAAEKLEAAGEAVAVRARHYDWCLALAERAQPHLTGAEQATWLGRLEREHDNLRTALRWALDRQETAKGLQLA